jgi:hypothetical protein
MDKLKRCPFCGQKCRIKIEVSDVDNMLYEVVCDNVFCPCFGAEDEDNPNGYGDKEEAIKAWNTRTSKR